MYKSEKIQEYKDKKYQEYKNTILKIKQREPYWLAGKIATAILGGALGTAVSNAIKKSTLTRNIRLKEKLLQKAISLGASDRRILDISSGIDSLKEALEIAKSKEGILKDILHGGLIGGAVGFAGSALLENSINRAMLEKTKPEDEVVSDFNDQFRLGIRTLHAANKSSGELRGWTKRFDSLYGIMM